MNSTSACTCQRGPLLLARPVPSTHKRRRRGEANASQTVHPGEPLQAVVLSSIRPPVPVDFNEVLHEQPATPAFMLDSNTAEAEDFQLHPAPGDSKERSAGTERLSPDGSNASRVKKLILHDADSVAELAGGRDMSSLADLTMVNSPCLFELEDASQLLRLVRFTIKHSRNLRFSKGDWMQALTGIPNLSIDSIAIDDFHEFLQKAKSTIHGYFNIQPRDGELELSSFTNFNVHFPHLRSLHLESKVQHVVYIQTCPLLESLILGGQAGVVFVERKEEKDSHSAAPCLRHLEVDNDLSIPLWSHHSLAQMPALESIDAKMTRRMATRFRKILTDPRLCPKVRIFPTCSISSQSRALILVCIIIQLRTVRLHIEPDGSEAAERVSLSFKLLRKRPYRRVTALPCGP